MFNPISRNDGKPVRRLLWVLVPAGLAVAIVGIGVAGRLSHAEQLRERAAERAIPSVSVVTPSRVRGADLELPARIEAWAQAPIYARASGYLKQWHVDIGENVQAGQVLAEIETPDLDQQLLQARAELARARSEAALAATTAQRWQSLLASNTVSKQGAEEKSADLNAKQALVQAAEANLERIRALQQYQRLTAPFDGVVTARKTDVGALINDGMEEGSELFVVSDTRKLRVYVQVPQRQIAAVRVGGVAQIAVPERPGSVYAASVQSISRAIDQRSGAMLVQLAVDNPSGELLPGGYARAQFETVLLEGGIGLPASALIVDGSGVRVATVDSEGQARLKTIAIARDYGSMVELVSGLEPGERVIESPPDGLEDGDFVRVAQPLETALNN